MTLKLSLIATRASDLARLSANLPASSDQLQVFTSSGDRNSLFADLNRQKPHVAVADFDSITPSELLTLEAAIKLLPQTCFILLTADRSPEFLLSAMRIGVREVVPTPLLNGELKEALARQIDRAAITSGVNSQGRVIAFVSAKGGSGATFLATSVSVALSIRGQRVGFFDLNLQFGDAVMYLTEKQSTTNLSDLVRQVDRLDSDFLRALMMPINDKLWALPGPDTPERSMEIKPQAVDAILNLSRSCFDYTVLDIARGIDAVSVKALDLCDEIYVVMQYSVPSIQDSKRLLSLMASLGYSRDKVHLLANRVQKGSDIGGEDVQKALGVLVRHQIPNSWPAAVYTANHGVPIFEHAAKDPLSKALNEFAAMLNPKQSVPSKSSWLGNLMSSRKPS
jgi:pilus assembly protein CpaE